MTYFSMNNGVDTSILAVTDLANKVEIKDESKDSGINSSTSIDKGYTGNIIIPFQALNFHLDDTSLNTAVLQSSVIIDNKLDGPVPECSTIQGSANVGRDISRGLFFTRTLLWINSTIKYVYLDFDDSYDDSILGLNKGIKKAEVEVKEEKEQEGLLLSDDGRVVKNLDHVMFEKLPKMLNGIRFLSLEHPLDITDIGDMDVFKMRIANPVRL